MPEWRRYTLISEYHLTLPPICIEYSTITPSISMGAITAGSVHIALTEHWASE